LGQVAVHDLQVVDVADELDVRRADALADIDAPVPVTEYLILAPEARIRAPVVHVLDRDRHAAILELALDAIQERDGVVRAFRERHTAALAADGNDRANALRRAHVDVRPDGSLDLVVHFRMDDAVLERDAARADEQRLEAVTAERRPVLGPDQIEAVHAEPRGFAAHVVERQSRGLAEVHAPEALLDAALERRRGRAAGRWLRGGRLDDGGNARGDGSPAYPA